MKVKVGCAMDIVGCIHEFVVELEDSLTVEELEHVIREIVFEHFEWYYEKVDDEG